WLYAQTGKTGAIANERLYNLLHEWLTTAGGIAYEASVAALADDYIASRARGVVLPVRRLRLRCVRRAICSSRNTLIGRVSSAPEGAWSPRPWHPRNRSHRLVRTRL